MQLRLGNAAQDNAVVGIEIDDRIAVAVIMRRVERVHGDDQGAVGGAPGDGAARLSETEAQEAAFAVRGVVAGYGDAEVVHGVDLRVERGKVTALLGANGAGKSTLCSVAAGMVEASLGTVYLEGKEITHDEPFRRARAGILLVPEARGIFPGLTVEENLTVLLRDEQLRKDAYERFPILRERRKQVAGLLSGGEQQMLSLAPALVNPPAVFVADEPTLGLAPLAADEIMTAIRRLRDLGSTILLVEEKAHEAEFLAPEWINWPTIAFYAIKVVLVAGAYALLGFALADRIS